MADNANAPQAGAPAPHQPTTSHTSRYQSSISANVLGSIAHLGRTDSVRHATTIAVNVNGWNDFPGRCYDLLVTMSVAELPITRDNFIRVSKTLLLKRLMDVHEMVHTTRPDHYVRISRHVGLPAPIADTLHSIGYYLSPSSGAYFMPAVPARAAQPEPFWTVDTALMDQWVNTIAQLESSYMMREYPSPSDTGFRPWISARLETHNATRRVMIHNTETSLADAFSRLVNDDVFTGQPENMTQTIGIDFVEMSTLRSEYMRSYVLHPFRGQ